MATMLSGLDSILREPYGCFEQASSANYPNIMVVRYMQDRNIAKPDVLARSTGSSSRGTARSPPSRAATALRVVRRRSGHEALTRTA